MNFQDEKKVAEIISRKLADRITPEEEKTLAGWLDRSGENRAVYAELISGKSIGKRRELEETIDFREELHTVKKIARKMIRRRRLSVRLAGAATAAILITGAVFVSRQWATEDGSMALAAPGMAQAILTVGDAVPVALEGADSETEWQDYLPAGIPKETEVTEEATMVKVEVPNGGEYKLQLADGTLVWLNSESTIEYPSFFSDGERTIRLTGEAYLEVARDERKPFVLTTDQASITVLGTSFNVSAYETDGATTATLVSGRIEICNEVRCVELTPGKQAVVSGSSAGIEVKDVDTGLFTAWTTGMFEFENMRLEDICTRLSRWYGVSFRFEGDSADERFTGAIWKYKPLGELLKGIEMVTDVSFSYAKDKIIASYSK